MIDQITIYKNTAKIHLRAVELSCPVDVPDYTDRNVRGKIDSFSAGSRRRLKFLAGNVEGDFYQMALTYHNDFPIDGRQTKSDLKKFRARLSKTCPDLRYLWILEFQERGAPHYHFFVDTTGYDNEGLRLYIADAWTQRPGISQESVAWHHHKSNWMPWQMHDGQYLTKYLDKQKQKLVPPEFHDVGRFWGKSRSLRVVNPVFIDTFTLTNSILSKKSVDLFVKRAVNGYLTSIHRRFGKCPGWLKLYRQSFMRPQESPRVKTFTFQSIAPLIWQLVQHFEKEQLVYG